VCAWGGRERGRRAMTLAEVVMAIALTAMMLAAVVTGYVQVFQQAEWSNHALAAQALAHARVEQALASSWKPLMDEDALVASNFPPRVELLSATRTGTNISLATNTVRITTVANNPPLRMIEVECVWSWRGERVFTNRLVTYRAPD